MHWEIVSAVAAACVPIAGLLWYMTKLMVRTVVRDDNDRMLREINGTYVRSAGSRLTGFEVERRLDLAEQRVDNLNDYAHSRNHELANAIQRITPPRTAD